MRVLPIIQQVAEAAGQTTLNKITDRIHGVKNGQMSYNLWEANSGAEAQCGHGFGYQLRTLSKLW